MRLILIWRWLQFLLRRFSHRQKFFVCASNILVDLYFWSLSGDGDIFRMLTHDLVASLDVYFSDALDVDLASGRAVSKCNWKWQSKKRPVWQPKSRPVDPGVTWGRRGVRVCGFPTYKDVLGEPHGTQNGRQRTNSTTG